MSNNRSCVLRVRCFAILELTITGTLLLCLCIAYFKDKILGQDFKYNGCNNGWNYYCREPGELIVSLKLMYNKTDSFIIHLVYFFVCVGLFVSTLRGKWAELANLWLFVSSICVVVGFFNIVWTGSALLYKHPLSSLLISFQHFERAVLFASSRIIGIFIVGEFFCRSEIYDDDDDDISEVNVSVVNRSVSGETDNPVPSAPFDVTERPPPSYNEVIKVMRPKYSS